MTPTHAYIILCSVTLWLAVTLVMYLATVNCDYLTTELHMMPVTGEPVALLSVLPATCNEYKQYVNTEN